MGRKKRSRRLRWRLAVPLMVAFALVWLGSMALLTGAAADKLEQAMSLQYQYAREILEEQWGYYENNLANGLGDEAARIMEDNLSAASGALIDFGEGGMAFLVRDEAGREIRSQLAWGYGNETGVDVGQRWYLRLDEGLDDAGQIALAQWIVEHRVTWGYALYPADSRQAEFRAERDQPMSDCDGTFARVTGIKRPGYAVAVQKIEIIHPDGTTETMVETSVEGENPVVLDLSFVKISSLLLPDWRSDGKDSPVDMEKRLANYREAQAILDREAAGQRQSVQTSGGRLLGMSGGEDGVMRMVAGECDISAAARSELWFAYLSTFALTTVVVLLLSAYLSRKVTEPVEALCRDSEKGHCREDGPVRELNALATAFNGAQARLEGQLERERNFTRSAAHELKTPLAVLRTYAEALLEDIAPEKREAYLAVVLEESDRMAALVSQLLELSRLEAGKPLNRKLVSLRELVQEVWNPLTLALEQRQIQLQLDLEEIGFMGDRERLKEAVENLATNALRHCTPGGQIRVELARREEDVELCVTNDGAAIPAEDLPHLFEPFYRGDKSRSRESGGTGLGLAIVRAAVQAHGGDCRVENCDGGVCFRLRFPRGFQ